jgi:aromatic ring-opening dioxygenase catalytic subunit (LigB family)
MFPALFVSHGAPTLPFDDVPARDFLRGLGREIGKPRAILIVYDRLMAGDETALAGYRKLAPDAVLAQPSEDHFMPLFVALGAGGETSKATRLHSGATFGSLRMDAYSFS